MSKDKRSSSSTEEIISLISAVASGDAAREDIVSSLKDKGVDSLDVLVEVLARVTKKNEDKSHPLDPQRLSSATPVGSQTDTVHRVPNQPFLLRGTLYDPADVERFNGKELHFLSAPGRDHLLVFDDRGPIESWWQLSFISASLISYDRPKTLTAEGRGSVDVTTSVEPTDFGGPTVIVAPPGGSSGPEGFSGASAPPPPAPHTNFYEDVNNGGSRIVLAPNRGYDDLTEVPYTFFGTGDWNDTISSIELIYTKVAVLYEHVDYAGQTFTATQNVTDLGSWNDVASSCGTW